MLLTLGLDSQVKVISFLFIPFVIDVDGEACLFFFFFKKKKSILVGHLTTQSPRPIIRTSSDPKVRGNSQVRSGLLLFDGGGAPFFI